MHIGTLAPRAALTAALALFVSTVAPATPAHARSLSAGIKVNPADLSAVGYIRDGVFGGWYTATLTAVGPVVCGVAGAQTVILASGRAYGNPAQPTTPGTCTSRYTGVVVYDLVWTGQISGHTTRVCTVTAGLVVCTPEEATVDVPDAS